MRVNNILCRARWCWQATASAASQRGEAEQEHNQLHVSLSSHSAACRATLSGAVPPCDVRDATDA